MKTKQPNAWMPFYGDDFMRDTMHLSAACRGAYLALLWAAWHRDGKLPDDHDALRRLAGCDAEEWDKVWPLILQFFSKKKGGLVQGRLERELHAAKNRYKKSTKKTEKARAIVMANRAKNQASKSVTDSVTESVTGGTTTTTTTTTTKSKDVSLRDMSELPAATSDVVPLVPPDKPGRLRQEASELLAFLNAKTGRHFRPTDTTLKPIMGRLKEGFTIHECKAVIARKVRAWKGDDRLSPYLRPETLFGATKFAQYVGEVPQEVAATP